MSDFCPVFVLRIHFKFLFAYTWMSKCKDKSIVRVTSCRINISVVAC